jgi:hypothetical protein
MRYPRCQHENRPQAKLCEECASPLARICPNCGTQSSLVPSSVRNAITAEGNVTVKPLGPVPRLKGTTEGSADPSWLPWRVP